MSGTVWTVIGVVFVIVWVWLGWEAYNAPMDPDEEENEEI
jgi:hypothetical protein